MSDAQIGSLLLVGFEGTTVTPELASYVQEDPPAGVVLFQRNIESLDQVAGLLRQLRALWPDGAPTPLFAVDQEGGPVRRLRAPECPSFLPLPAARELGDAGRLEVTREAGRITASQLASLGFNLNFAPVMDVDSNPDNPIIGARAFAADPEGVAAHGRAWSEGSQLGGVLSCAKHFPGHGDTDTDSHLALPMIAHGVERLRDIELAPFAAATRWSIPSIMTAHVLFRALDPEWPATLSEKVIPSLLRDELGYEGVVISDDLEMKAIADHHDPEIIATRGLQATVDLFLVCRHLTLAAEIREALRSATGRDDALAQRAARAHARISRLRDQAADNAARPWAGELPHQADAEALIALLTG